MRKLRNCLLFSGSLFILGSCASIGPKQINVDRGAYNDIVRQTDYEQLLKNIVFVRYAEPTAYLKVTSVTASYQFVRSLHGDFAGEISNTTNNEVAPSVSTGTFGVSPGISYSDAPTISYVPINDATFVAALQQPVTLSDIAMLVTSGLYNYEVLNRLIFDWVGDLDNASVAASPLVEDIPHYDKYHQYTQLMVKMIKDERLWLDAVNINGQQGLILDFIGDHYKDADAMEIKKLVGVSPDVHDIVLAQQNVINIKLNKDRELYEEDSTNLARNLVYVQTRSLNGIIAFLAHGVHVPQADIDAGYVPMLKYPDGRPYDWSPLMKDLISIECSDKEPMNVFVKTWANGHWFYISKSDIRSKMTFTMLVRLMTLKAGLGQAGGQTTPVITVPVGANAHNG